MKMILSGVLTLTSVFALTFSGSDAEAYPCSGYAVDRNGKVIESYTVIVVPGLFYARGNGPITVTITKKDLTDGTQSIIANGVLGESTSVDNTVTVTFPDGKIETVFDGEWGTLKGTMQLNPKRKVEIGCIVDG